ncbi:MULTISPECIES: hypothetical protein [unclassified Synechococcus]|nr:MULTISPECIES: hypothetical protein [unclassified Synechococcus]
MSEPKTARNPWDSIPTPQPSRPGDATRASDLIIPSVNERADKARGK